MKKSSIESDVIEVKDIDTYQRLIIYIMCNIFDMKR